jgi:hypothetical protein
VALSFDLEHAESGDLVEKRDALNQPRKALRQWCGCVLHRALILKLVAKNGKRHLWKDASGAGWHIRDSQSADWPLDFKDDPPINSPPASTPN